MLSKTLQASRSFATARTNAAFSALDAKYVANNYATAPVALERGEGCYVWDVEGKKYVDWIAGISACNQGHTHPKIIKALCDQAQKICQPSRAFGTVEMGPFCEYFTQLIGYDKFLPSSGGVEACESACKLARRWGYVVKGIPDDHANVLMAKKCFWGRSITAASGCNDPLRMKHFGPFTPGFPLVDYDDVDAIENYLKNDPHCAGVMLESIQGEAGVIIPQDGYLAKVKALCVKYNVLLLVDEVQTGLGRTGKLMDYMYDMGEDKPDVVTFGKSISGGVTPVSGICADAHLMDLINPGEHGSTFGGMPIAMAAAHAACKAIVEEGMVENSFKVGEHVRKSFRDLNSPHIKEVRGRGMLNAMEFHEGKAAQFVDSLRKHGLIVRPSGANVVKFTPAIIMTEQIVDQSMEIFEKALAETF